MIGVYLNVVAVIVLEEPSDAFCPDSSPDPLEVHGVDCLRRLPEVEVVVNEGNGDEEEKDREVF
jgi:hypothetical protein